MLFFFFFNDTATTEIYTLSLHDALPICAGKAEKSLPTQLPGHDNRPLQAAGFGPRPRAQSQGPAARLRHIVARSEEHTSELQSRLHLVCRLLLEKKKKKSQQRRTGM